MNRRANRRAVLKGASVGFGVGVAWLALPARAQAGVANALSFIPESLHADILAGTSTADVASYLNEGLRSDRLIALPPFGQMSIGSTLKVPSFGGILGVNYGCTIRALQNLGDNPLIRNATRAPTTNAARDRNILLTGIRLDGKKASNFSATEFSHGIELAAVDGAKLDVQVVNPKGDGLCITSSRAEGEPPASINPEIGCSYVSGKIRTAGCARHGVAIVCGEQIDLDIYDTAASFMSLDIEPDVRGNFIRNIFIRLLSQGAGNGSDVSGGFVVGGSTTGSIPTNVMVDFEIHNSGGQGAIWRDAKGLILRGTIDNPANNGLWGIGAGFGPSTVSFQDVKVFTPGGQGLVALETPGSIYDGNVSIEGARGGGVQIENAAGGTLGLRIRNSAQHGMLLSNTDHMTFPSLLCENNKSHNVWLRNGCNGNRFHALKSVGSTFGFGFLEEAGCNENRAFLSQVSGNAAGNVSISGAQSLVQLEP